MSSLRVVPFALMMCLAACGEDPPPATPATPPPPPAATPDAPPPPPPVAVKPSLAEMQKQDVGTVLQGIVKHDPKMFASVYSDNAVISVAGLNEVNGRDAIAQNMGEWFEVFSNAKLGFSRVWVKGETMVLEWVINGTEQPIGHSGLSVVTFDADGKVSKENRYGELGSVMSQLAGGAKAKARPIPEIPAAPETFVAAGDDKNIEVAKSVLAALEGKKEDAFTSLLTDDVEQDGLFALETSKGKDGAKKFFKAFTTAFPDAKFEVTRTVAVGDYVIAESMLEGTQKGALGSIAATKRPIAIHLADVFRIKEGKVSRAWTYQNSLELQQQLGLFNVNAGAVPASQAPAKK